MDVKNDEMIHAQFKSTMTWAEVIKRLQSM